MDDWQIHQNQPVFTHGAPLRDAHGAVILLHGRGSTAQTMLRLAAQLPQGTVAYLVPQAAHQTWYPNSGFVPIEANEPHVSSAFRRISDILGHIAASGLAADRVVLGGFSQGACLAAEYVARHARRYGGLFVLSGALMGPLDAPRQYAGSLDGTPVFVSGSARDSWVSQDQLHLSGRVLGELGAVARVEVWPGAEHTIRQPEIARVGEMISEALMDRDT